MNISVNGIAHTSEAEGDTPLLWVLRDQLGLTGTKFGCGVGVCGTCVVLLDGKPVRSCLVRLGEVGDRVVTTIEGLSADGNHPVQQAWEELQVAQCGYCQSGQILTAVALIDMTDEPSDEDIDKVMSGVLCRCGTYPRIKKAIKLAARKMAGNRNKP